MADKQLLEYIKQQLQQGITKEQIKNSLLSAGWQAQDIDEALNSSTPPTQPTSSPLRYKTLKIILGIATFWPIFYIGTFVFLFVTFGSIMAIGMWSGYGYSSKSSVGDSADISWVVPLIALLNNIFFYFTIILTPILLFIYLRHVFKNKSIPKSKKVLWVAVFFQVIFSAVLLLAIRNDILMNFVIDLGVFVITPYIAMTIYWHRYIWKQPNQNPSSGNISRLTYIFIALYVLLFLVIPVLLFGPRPYGEYLKAEDLKKQQLVAFENTQNINVYLPTTFEGKWKPQLNSSRGIVKFKYSLSSDYDYKEMAEIKSPKTDLGCTRKTYLELNKTIPEYWPVSEKLWLEKCEEISISGEKSVLSENEWIIKNQGYTFNAREYLMVFDKESTRIFLHSRNTFLESETPSPSETKNKLIRVAESLRPIKINLSDFKP